MTGQLLLDFGAPTAPALDPPADPVPVEVQPDHDPWAKWPWNDDTAPDHVKALSKCLDDAYGWTHDLRTFDLALDLWTACLDRCQGGEEEYLRISKDVPPQALRAISRGFGVLLQHFYVEGGYFDLLGAVYMEVRSTWAGTKLGQFFTPWDLCLMMARMQLDGPDLEEKIRTRSEITVCDPACGSGAMLLATKATVAALHGRSATRILRLHGQDIDGTCCKMARLQIRMTSERFMHAWAQVAEMDLRVTMQARAAATNGDQDQIKSKTAKRSRR